MSPENCFKIPAEWYYKLLGMSGRDWLRIELIDGEVFEIPPGRTGTPSASR